MTDTAYPFDPTRHENELRAILDEVERAPELDPRTLGSILRRHPKDGCGFFSKSEILRGYRFLREQGGGGLPECEQSLTEKLRMKPVRTQSGVAPVTVLTKPFPCPGKCVFCPSDVQMPKSYLSDEPGAQRAAEHQFDPYRQTFSRLLSLFNTGHVVDKVELIVLGGTWSFYPEPYQIWFVQRCFEAMNDFARGVREIPQWPLSECGESVDFRQLGERVDGAEPGAGYNRTVSEWVARQPAAEIQQAREQATWEALDAVQRDNESASVRCVGLSLETRPDHISRDEVARVRRLGATKVQIGYQSLDDEVLKLNRRGHDVAATRAAMKLLRQAGFKIQAHWMPNLYGSTPQRDVADFARLFADADFRPDELKVYPCSLIESAELMRFYRGGEWRPYDHDELLDVLTRCLGEVPAYCRVTRVIRDIPGTDIVVGNKVTNFRQVAEGEMQRRGWPRRDIRSREIGRRAVHFSELYSETLEYEVTTGRELFLQWVTGEDRLAGFLRLQLPEEPSFLEELASSAVIREVHVYGAVVGLGERDEGGSAQHLGLGRRLIAQAAEIAAGSGYYSLAVISSVGTREYYRRLGFRDGALYQHRALGGSERGRR